MEKETTVKQVDTVTVCKAATTQAVMAKFRPSVYFEVVLNSNSLKGAKGIKALMSKMESERRTAIVMIRGHLPRRFLHVRHDRVAFLGVPARTTKAEAKVYKDAFIRDQESSMWSWDLNPDFRTINGERLREVSE